MSSYLENWENLGQTTVFCDIYPDTGGTLKKADCVIDMLGGDFAVRKREALSLVEKGVADVMLIPAWRKMIRYDGCSRKHVAGEYLKIGWFLVYSWFV